LIKLPTHYPQLASINSNGENPHDYRASFKHNLPNWCLVGAACGFSLIC
jgi:hypothetical protein